MILAEALAVAVPIWLAGAAVFAIDYALPELYEGDVTHSGCGCSRCWPPAPGARR